MARYLAKRTAVCIAMLALWFGGIAEPVLGGGIVVSDLWEHAGIRSSRFEPGGRPYRIWETKRPVPMHRAFARSEGYGRSA